MISIIEAPSILSIYILLIGCIASFLLSYFTNKGRFRRRNYPPLALDKVLDNPKCVDKDFDYEKAQPEQHRPFYPARKGPLRMGLRSISFDKWLMLDRDVKKTLDKRSEYLKLWSDGRLLVEDGTSTQACRELWETATEFMAAKYPEYYRFDNGYFKNRITGTETPRFGKNMRNLDILKALAGNFEDDFFLLGFDSDLQEYVVRACVHLHPTGFNPKDILNKPISSLHAPVPHYQEQLHKPMSKIFSKFKVGDCMQRLNWSCQTGENLCLPDELSKETELIKQRDGCKVNRTTTDAPDPSKMYLRVERQTLIRLPKSQFVVFTVRTYLYKLKQLKDEGYGDALCESIDNLDYEFGHYKGRPVWGDAVKEYFEK